MPLPTHNPTAWLVDSIFHFVYVTMSSTTVLAMIWAATIWSYVHSRKIEDGKRWSGYDECYREPTKGWVHTTGQRLLLVIPLIFSLAVWFVIEYFATSQLINMATRVSPDDLPISWR